MNNPIEQFSAASKANVDAVANLANTAFAGVEKLVELNLATSKEVLSESFSNAKAALGAKDVQELMALQQSLLKPLAEKSTAYVQQVQAIVTGSSAELTHAVEAQTAETQKVLVGVVEDLAKNAPAGAESAVAVFKNAMTAGQAAIQSAQAQTQKVVEAAQTNFAQASKQTVDTVKKATKVS